MLCQEHFLFIMNNFFNKRKNNLENLPKCVFVHWGKLTVFYKTSHC